MNILLYPNYHPATRIAEIAKLATATQRLFATTSIPAEVVVSPVPVVLLLPVDVLSAAAATVAKNEFHDATVAEGAA